MTLNAEEIKKVVRERYAALARAKSRSCCAPQAEASAGCCDTAAVISRQSQARASRLYSREELEKLSADVADISLGCGNPTAMAELSEDEVVVDLGSGGGIDCFLAARKVGMRGRVVGLDMTLEMIQLARDNALKMGIDNVEFRLGEMEHMPVEDSSVDVIISNCVINLSPDKDAVFREAYRVLKPGGRLCVSDMMLVGELPKEVKTSLGQWAACIAGALSQEAYLNKIRAAGLVVVGAERETAGSEGRAALKDKVASVRVKAFKPGKA